MSFLAPVFLAGLLAISIPILIHLVKRERGVLVPFPSLMFLRKLPHESTRQRTIRHWALLLLRAAAIMLIVAAFARPVFRRETLAIGPATGAREVVILVDRSYSMAYGDRWERARAAARQAIEALAPADRATLVFFGRGADADLRSTGDTRRLLATLDAAQVGADVTRYGPALKLAQSILDSSTLPRREVILVSDFQKNGWTVDGSAAELPAGTVITPVATGDPETANVTLGSVAFARQIFAGQERITITAGLTNRSPHPVQSLEVRLELSGRQPDIRKVDLSADGSASVSFGAMTLTEPILRGTVRVPADALPRDDAYHFILSPARPVPVLLVDQPEGGRNASLYLSKALAIGDRPVFQTERVRPDRLTPPNLESRSVVVLNEVAPARGSTTDALRDYVRQGGGLLAVLGDRGNWPAREPLLPGSVGGLVDRASGLEASLSGVDYAHAIFEVFRAPRTGDLAGARFFRYRRFTPTEPNRVLARFDDGAPALVEGGLGTGRVLVWTSTLDSFWNDLALKAVYLPFIHRMVAYLGGYQEPQAWLSVGHVVDVTRLAGLAPAVASDAEGATVVVQLPSGRRATFGAPDASPLLPLEEEGFYEVHAPGAPRSQTRVVAVNLDRSESDLTPMDPLTLVGQLGADGAGRTPGGAQTTVTPEEEERRQSVWWYLLLGGIGLLAVENVLSNRLLRSRPEGGAARIS